MAQTADPGRDEAKVVTWALITDFDALVWSKILPDLLITETKIHIYCILHYIYSCQNKRKMKSISSAIVSLQDT